MEELEVAPRFLIATSIRDSQNQDQTEKLEVIPQA